MRSPRSCATCSNRSISTGPPAAGGPPAGGSHGRTPERTPRATTSFTRVPGRHPFGLLVELAVVDLLEELRLDHLGFHELHAVVLDEELLRHGEALLALLWVVGEDDALLGAFLAAHGVDAAVGNLDQQAAVLFEV